MTRKPQAELPVDENAPTLQSLAPFYEHEHHGMYFTVIKKAIETQPKVRNIALAGTYGTGKSSILHQVREQFAERVIELSLLTLGEKPDAAPSPGEMNPAAASTTNRIQKEVVKQLLYQQSPTNAPESRFRRISRFKWRTELTLAIVLSLFGVAVAALLGLDVTVTPAPGLALDDRPHALRVIVAYGAGAVLIVAAVVAARLLFRGRGAIEKVSAGPATITLPPHSVSYFDEYLDEIIYFFEMNPQVDIVIIEDLDRFNDPHIFEALRSLNGLLNAARQLKGRDIRFIYAVRDSVFGKLGQDEEHADTDEARAEIARSNRTKFFELIVPVVPFITHRNARELIGKMLGDRKHTVSPDLIDLAGRHLADMRLIRNIVNEFEIFKHRLLDGAQRVPGLDSDRLFAIVVFKNAHMADFEKIRLAKSSLDLLWDAGRDLMSTNRERLRSDNRERTSRINRASAAPAHARQLGRRVRDQIDLLAAIPGTGVSAATIEHNGAPVSDETLATPEFWRIFIESKAPLHVPSLDAALRRDGAMRFDAAIIEQLTGLEVNAERFVQDKAADERTAIHRNDLDSNFLRRPTWQQLAGRPQFEFAGDDGTARSFRGWIEHLLPSKLAKDLVINGYITHYFPLHVSSFYGQTIRPDAMTYVMRYVDTGIADVDYELLPADVEAIILDQGKSVLSERSMLNITIVDHLLKSRTADARSVISTIEFGDEEELFVDRYLAAGRQKAAFVAQLAQVTGDVFGLLDETTAVEAADKIELIDVAARNVVGNMAYKYPSGLSTFLSDNYADMPTLASGTNDRSMKQLLDLFTATNTVIADVSILPKTVHAAFGNTRAYAFTRENLEAVTGAKNLSLDSLKSANLEVLAYARENMTRYLEIVSESDETEYTVTSPSLFAEVLDDAGGWADGDGVAFVTRAGSDCVVEALTGLPVEVWPALVATQRVPMSWSNVFAYIDRFGGVTSTLGAALKDVSSITDSGDADVSERVRVALAILNAEASELDATKRVHLAFHLRTGVLNVASIAPRSGSLVGDLIAEEMIADDENAFSSRLMVDWSTQAHTMLASSEFASFIGPSVLKPTYVKHVFEDDRFAPLHAPLRDALRSYSGAVPGAFSALAELAIAGKVELNASDIVLAQSAGLNRAKVVHLLAVSAARVPFDELVAVLRRLSGAWPKLTKRGYGVHTVPATSGAAEVLGRLQRQGIVSKVRVAGDEVKVSLRRP